MVVQNIFVEVGVIIILSTTLGYILRLLKQPLIPAYVIAGLLLGPLFGIAPGDKSLMTMSDIGIAFLLFIVGLEINIQKLRDVGLVAILGGVCNSSMMFILGFITASLIGFATADSLYLGLVVAFGSTMVVVKLLSDKKELDTLHGRILVGILLMEDLLSIIILSSLSNSNMFLSILKFLGLLSGAVMLGRYVLPSVFRQGAKHQELLFLLSLSMCFSFSIAAIFLGLSVVIGSFIAGLTIANLPYRVEIISRVRPIRDFFSTIFFVSLGMQVVVASISSVIKPFLALFFLVTIVKPFVLMNNVSFFGYRKKTSFLTGISLAQVSEFALIITALGKSLGQISDAVFTLSILLAISTIILSTYLLKYDGKIFHHLSSRLGFLDKNNVGSEAGETPSPGSKKEVVLCGYNRIGFNIVNSLQSLKKDFLVIDYNPEVIKTLTSKGIPCLYGDVGDTDVIEQANIYEANMVISTIPDFSDTMLLIQKTREKNKGATLIVTASQLSDALLFYSEGADYVVLPHFLGGEHVSRLIDEFNQDASNIVHTRLRHIEELQIREALGHEHPAHD